MRQFVMLVVLGLLMIGCGDASVVGPSTAKPAQEQETFVTQPDRQNVEDDNIVWGTLR